ncbi:hypothetical protein GCM10027161_07070 [Microbispora hainanensis]
MQIAHLAGEQLHVGAADADPLDVDDHLPGRGGGWIDVHDLGPAGAGDDQCPHYREPGTGATAPTRVRGKVVSP